MSIQPKIDRWERRFMLCVAIVLCAMLVTGARQVGRDLYERPALVERAHDTQRQWSQTLAGEMASGGGTSGWSRIAEEAPELMLEACASRPMASK
ncbi:MAG: hypothetical protein HN849_12915 [Victivallales bacterium]|jgi:hypothetical protein|nr:hypothetical protein [Victivallales bacterium]MBT7164972.1 hypothetical protein [Victivallales bacterium]MBT7300414.1 hypothetical protein [Victivallales bacterium]